MPTTRPVIAALADDLTGAVETAGSFLSCSSDVRVVLEPSHDAWSTQRCRAGTRVVDLDCRYGRADRPHKAVLEALNALGAPAQFVKIDSLLRGNVASVVGALTTATDLVVFAPSLPFLGRVVCGGVPLIDGEPLSRSAAWSSESAAAPATLTDVLGQVPCEVVSIADVRSPQLGTILENCAKRHVVAACDALRDSDLEAIVAAARRIEISTFVGSGGLAQALASSLAVSAETSSSKPKTSGALGRILVATSSREPELHNQLAGLRSAGVEVIDLPMRELGGDAVSRAMTEHVAEALRAGSVALRPSPEADLVPGLRRTVSEALGLLVREVGVALGSLPDLFVIGGETARRVLEACGIRHLKVIDRLGAATVRCETSGGVQVVLRPGSYGPADPVAGTLRALGVLEGDPPSSARARSADR